MMKTILVAVAIAVSVSGAGKTGGVMSKQATGTFEVKVTPVPGELPFPRFTLAKEFRGDLAGTSQGEMMSVDATVEGSGAYVAIERIRGTLHGREGTFSVIHNGTMRRNADFSIAIRVVPDSGTGALTGLTGTMQIIIAGGKHSYTIDYSLPE